MRVAVVTAPKSGESSKLKGVADSIVRTLEKRGYSSDIINTSLDSDKKLILFDYIVFVSEGLSLFSKNLPSSLGTYLRNCGNISGKRAAVVLTGGTLRKGATMAGLMKIVEGEGVILKTSQIISKPSEAEAFASNLNVERNY